MLRRAQVRILIENPVGPVSREIQRLVIGELGDAQFRQSRLPRAEVLARTAHLQVGLGQVKAVRRLHHQLEPLTALFKLGV